VSGSGSGINLRLLSRRRWRIVLVLWFLATLVLGTAGYVDYAGKIGADRSVLTALYHTAQLFILHAPHFEHHLAPGLEFARWSAALFFGVTVLRIGRQLFPGEYATLRCLLFRNHVVIGGLGRKALQCVRFERGKPRGQRRNVVVIDHAPSDELSWAASSLGAVVLTGDVNDPDVLRSAGLRRAGELWALCGEDGVNCEMAVQAHQILARRSARGGIPLEGRIHLLDVDLRVELQRHARVATRGVPLNLRFFDLYDHEARRVLLTELPIDHGGIGAQEIRRPHLIILGFGRMGRSIAVRAAKLGHFANAVDRAERRLRISVIDRNARQAESALRFRYPQFRETCDFDAHQADIESPEARTLIEQWCSDPAALPSLTVCFDDAARATEVGLRLLPILSPDAVRIAIRIGQREGLGNMVDAMWSDSATRARVRTFGRLDERCCEAGLEDPTNEALARAIHEDFVGRRVAQGERDPTDRSMTPWPVLDEDLRESNRQQADHIMIKLRSIGVETLPLERPASDGFEFTAGEIELLSRMEHNRWNAERLMAGWTRGPKNVERRTSPYLCEWAELPESVQEYDRAAVRSIPTLLKRVGLRPVRCQP
jgi:hypothetical protein